MREYTLGSTCSECGPVAGYCLLIAERLTASEEGLYTLKLVSMQCAVFHETRCRLCATVADNNCVLCNQFRIINNPSMTVTGLWELTDFVTKAFKSKYLLRVSHALTFRNSAFCAHRVYDSGDPKKPGDYFHKQYKSADVCNERAVCFLCCRY